MNTMKWMEIQTSRPIRKDGMIFEGNIKGLLVINLVYRDVSRFGQYPTISGCIALGRSWRKIVASRPPIPVIAAKTNNRGSRPPIRSDPFRSDRSIEYTPNPRVGCCLLTALSWVDFDRGAGEASIKSKENLSRFPRLRLPLLPP